MSLARKGLVKPVRAEVPGEDAIPLPPLADLRRDVRGHPEGGARRAPRALRRWLQAQAREGRASASTTRSSATTSSRRIATAQSSSPPTSARAGPRRRRAAPCLGDGGPSALAREDLPAAVVMFERAAGAAARGSTAARLAALRDEAIALWEAGRADAGERARAPRTRGGCRRRRRMAALAELERVVVRAARERRRTTGESPRRVIASSCDGSATTSGSRWPGWLSSAHDVPARTRPLRRTARDALDACSTLASRRTRGSARRRRVVQAACSTARPRLRGAVRVHASSSPRSRTPTFEAGLATDARRARMRWTVDFDEARERYADAAAVSRSSGFACPAALTQIGVPLELLAGDPSRQSTRQRRAPRSMRVSGRSHCRRL